MKNVIKFVKSVKLLYVKFLNQLNVLLLLKTYYLMFIMIDRNDWLKLRFNCFFTIQSGNYLFQLTNHFIWFAFVVNFLIELKKQIWNKIAESTFADSDLFYFSSIIFKNITVLLKKQLFRKKCYSWGRTRLPKKVRRFTVAYKCPLSDKCCGREQFLL